MFAQGLSPFIWAKYHRNLRFDVCVARPTAISSRSFFCICGFRKSAKHTLVHVSPCTDAAVTAHVKVASLPRVSTVTRALIGDSFPHLISFSTSSMGSKQVHQYCIPFTSCFAPNRPRRESPIYNQNPQYLRKVSSDRKYPDYFLSIALWFLCRCAFASRCLRQFVSPKALVL